LSEALGLGREQKRILHLLRDTALQPAAERAARAESCAASEALRRLRVSLFSLFSFSFFFSPIQLSEFVSYTGLLAQSRERKRDLVSEGRRILFGRVFGRTADGNAARLQHGQFARREMTIQKK
jgi:hypothetical protein